jgi:aminoglycoside phosphotransferase (APT) family kinase protein
MSRRFPHIPFDLEQIQPFLNGRRLRSYQLLSGGKINSNYRIELAEGEIYLLRLYARGSAATEQYAMSFVQDVLPVPAVLFAGDGWAVMRFLPGKLLQQAPEAAADAGRALAQIAAVQFARPGELIPNNEPQSLPFDGFEGFIQLCLDNLEARRWLGPELIAGVQGLLRQEASRFAELNQEARLVHGDFNPTNILVDNGKISGVLDWEFAHAGTPYMDIGNLLRNLGSAYDEIVASGLREGGLELPPDWRERAALVDLASHMEFLTSTHGGEVKRAAVGRVVALLKNSYADNADKTQIARIYQMQGNRLSREVLNLDPSEEEELAEEGMATDSKEWPEY